MSGLTVAAEPAVRLIDEPVLEVVDSRALESAFGEVPDLVAAYNDPTTQSIRSI